MEQLEDAEIENQKIEKSDNCKQIVLLTPPFYISSSLKQQIKTLFRIRQIGDSFKNKSKPSECLQIINTNVIPANLTSFEGATLKTNTFIIIMGFSPKGFERSLMFHELSQKQSLSELEKSLKNFVSEKFPKKGLEKLKTQTFEFLKSVKNVFSNNFMLIPDVYFDSKEGLIREEKGEQEIIRLIGEALDKLVAAVGNKKNGKLQKKKVQQGGGDSFVEKKLQKKREKKWQNLIIVLPLTLPSVGKSNLFAQTLQLLHQKQKQNEDTKYSNFSIRTLCSQEIKQNLIEELLKKNINKKLSYEVLEQKIQKQKKQIWNTRLVELLQETRPLTSENNVLVLNKNFAPNSISNTVELIQENVPGNINYKIIVLFPAQCNEQPFITSKVRYPFSLDHLEFCISRAVTKHIMQKKEEELNQKQQHGSYTPSIYHQVSSVFLFFHLFRNVSLQIYSLKKFQIDYILEHQFKSPSMLEQQQNYKFSLNLVEEMQKYILKFDIQKLEEFEKNKEFVEFTNTLVDQFSCSQNDQVQLNPYFTELNYHQNAQNKADNNLLLSNSRIFMESLFDLFSKFFESQTLETQEQLMNKISE